MSASLEVPVLVLGGGPVGLLMAVGLRHGGVDSLVVEKHASTLDFPKGRRVTTRTVEILRQWGLEETVAEKSLAAADSLFSFEGDTLLGDDYERRALPFDEVKPTSPTRELICSQEHLEPVLRNRAMEVSDVRFSAEVLDFSQDDFLVTANVVMAGERVSVRAAYLVAADGLRAAPARCSASAGVVLASWVTGSASWWQPTSAREWRRAQAPFTGFGQAGRLPDRCSSRSTTRNAG